MRSASRIALLVAAVALPIAVVLGSYAFTGGSRTPDVPEKVRVGGESVPATQAPPPTGSVSGPPPGGHVPPPPPVDDDADDRDDDPDDE